MGCRNIQEHDFVRTLLIIHRGAFHRIAYIFDPDKIDSLHDPSVPYIQTRNDSFCKHDYPIPFPRFCLTFLCSDRQRVL